MKPLMLLIAADFTAATGPFLSIVIVLAAVIMVLNQFGLMPKGKTAERLKLDLDVSERELSRAKAELAVLRKQKDLTELTRLIIDHDKRMMDQAELIADKLNAISVAVIPPLNVRD